MARRGRVLGLTLLVATTLCALSSAQSTAQPTLPAMPSCPPAPISLSPCIGYVFGVGSATLSSCCSQLQTFFQAQGPCLCAVSKLAPSPLGLFLGQAQAMIPNICNLPSNPCDDAAGASTTPAVAGTTPPVAPLAPTAPVTSTETVTPPAAPTATAATTPTTTPADPDASGAPPAAAYDSPAAVTLPGQVAPAGVGSNTVSSEVGSKIPALLHSAGARSSRETAAGSVLITLFLAYVSTMYG